MTNIAYFWLIIAFLIGFFIGKLVNVYKLRQVKKEAIQKSRSILRGQFVEELSPFFPNFPYNPKDLKFFGAPIDYVVFDGLNEGNLQKITFLEIKTGKSQLNKNERQLKKVIEEGKVDYQVYRV